MIEKTITMKELHELYKTNEYEIEVEAPNKKWTNIVGLFNKEASGYKIKFDNQSIIDCAETHLLLTETVWEQSKNLQIGSSVYDKDFNLVKVIEKTKSEHTYWYDFTVDNEHSWYVQNDIIHHNSGKSLMLYIVLRYMIARKLRSMLIVPSIDLVHQMYTDFEDYFNTNLNKLEDALKQEKSEANISIIKSKINEIYHHRTLTNIDSIDKSFARIFGGQDKHTEHLIKISTYQSLSIENDRVDKSYFKDLDCVLIDETHKASAKTIKDIVNYSNKASWKSGVTGSLGADIIENLTIEGLLGSIKQVVTMRTLIDLGLATEIVIKPIVIKYPKDIVKAIKKMNYQEEDKFIRNLQERAEFLARILTSFKDKNVMLIYKNIDCAELLLKEVVKILAPEKEFNIKEYRKQNDLKLYYSQGNTKSTERNKFRGYMEEGKGCKIIGGVQIVSTGLNIKSLSTMILENIGKSITTTIQALGRSARLHKDKKQSIILDIVDDARYYSKSGKCYPNYKYKHYLERLDIYYQQEMTIDEPVSMNLKFDIL